MKTVKMDLEKTDLEKTEDRMSDNESNKTQIVYSKKTMEINAKLKEEREKAKFMKEMETMNMSPEMRMNGMNLSKFPNRDLALESMNGENDVDLVPSRTPEEHILTG